MEKGDCEICEKEKSKYCCPKCNILYCSLSCYKDQKHSICSEEFYKAAVLEELKEQNVDGNTKAAMIKILQNLDQTAHFIDPLADTTTEANLDSDDEPEEDLAKRMKGVNLNDGDALWDKLTDGERQQFQNLIDTGEIIDLLPKTEPWYMGKEGFVVPEISNKIPKYSKLSSKPPADSNKFNLLNILAAYSYMERYFLGDYNSFTEECCTCLCSLSTSLKRNSDIRDFETSFKVVFIEGISNQFEVDSGMEQRMVEDVRIILREKNYVLASLSDMLQLFKFTRKTNEPKNKGKFSKKFQDSFASETLDKKSCATIIKRLEYFLAYVKSYYESELTCFAEMQ